MQEAVISIQPPQHLLSNIDNKSVAISMFDLMKKLYPICRSLTGSGVDQTLDLIEELIPLKRTHLSTGTQVFDWTIPNEWNIRDAYIKDSTGKKIIDFKKSNLHVLNYSAPIHKFLSLEELKSHLFTLPQHPDWIPYLTAYYKENWGFCLSYNQYKTLVEDTYEVFIDATLAPGKLTFAEFIIPGKFKEEVLLTTYFCHPSLCNDNLSGVVLLTFLAKHIKSLELKYSYRFLFIPETIGAIAWLTLNEEKLPNIKHGLVATCLGDAGTMTYKKSRIGNALIDKVVEKVLYDSKESYTVNDYDPCGSDERQFCSPGINLPIGSLMRTQYGFYPEYHTSADNLDFINPDNLQDSLEKYLEVVNILEHDATFINTNPKCEPQLGRRGLYGLIGSNRLTNINEQAIFWILNFSDGDHSLLDIAIKSGIKFSDVKKAANALIATGLLRDK